MRREGQKSSAEAMPLRTRCFASARPVGETDDGERGVAELHVGLHLHPAGLEPDERVGEHASEHTRIEAANPSHVCVGTATIRAVYQGE